MTRRTLRDRAFQSIWRMRRSTTLGVRGVVVNDAGKVLLIRQTYTPGWHFPGGGVERGETSALALQRELMEEAGIEAEIPALQLVSVHANHAFFPNDHVLVFRVLNWTQREATQTGEVAEIQFADPLNPPADTTKGTRNRLGELFAGKPRVEHW